MSNDHKERKRQAIEEALGRADFQSMAMKYFPIRANGYAPVCPYCHKKGGKFRVWRTNAGHWAWGCYNTSCTVSFDNLKADRMGDMIGMIATAENCDRSKAIDILLETTGVTIPE